jgi:hypothetical protein
LTCSTTTLLPRACTCLSWGFLGMRGPGCTASCLRSWHLCTDLWVPILLHQLRHTLLFAPGRRTRQDTLWLCHKRGTRQAFRAVRRQRCGLHLRASECVRLTAAALDCCQQLRRCKALYQAQHICRCPDSAESLSFVRPFSLPRLPAIHRMCLRSRTQCSFLCILFCSNRCCRHG